MKIILIKKKKKNENNSRNNNSNNIKKDEEKNFEKGNNDENEKNKEKDDKINNIYTDNYLTDVNINKKINLEFSFFKHLNKFSYLFNFKGIQYCNDFSYLSDKYILTDESMFSDFLGQIYSFLYYVVPKSQGFDLSYSLISEDKIKILFQKTNFVNKGVHGFKKKKKNNSCIICDDKFKATSTVKTPEMTQEILYKLSEILGIKLKIMEYEDQKENVYLTIIMPYFIDEENDVLDSNINELPEDNLGKIPYLDEVVGRNILNSNNNHQSEIKDLEKNENTENNKNDNYIKINSKTEKDTTNYYKLKSYNEQNKNKNNNNNLNKLNLNFYQIAPERKASFLVEQVDEQNSSEEDGYSEYKEEEKKDYNKDSNENIYYIKKNQKKVPKVVIIKVVHQSLL